MQPSLSSVAEAIEAFGANIERGLDSGDAERRYAQDGPNELRSAETPSVWTRILAQFKDPLVYFLLGAVAIAVLAWGVEGADGWPVDAIVIAAVVSLNAVIGFAQEARAESSVAALERLSAATSTVLRDGREQVVPSARLVRGDLLVLREGDSVGADARLVEAHALRILEATLTGESEPVLKNTAALGSVVPLGDRLNQVFKGTAVVQGAGRAVVTATGMATEMGAIAKMLDSTAARPTPLQLEVARIGRHLGVAVLVICFVVVGVVLAMSDIQSASDVVGVLLLGVSLAVAAVPEGLPAILSVVLALGVQRMARRNAIVKKLSSVEALGCATVICSDKTGTLTRSEMTIQRVATASGCSQVTGVGYAPSGQVLHAGIELVDGPLRDEAVAVLSGGSLASRADLRQGDDGLWTIFGDPTEAAFLVAERKLGVDELRKKRFARVGEIPFSSERRMMSTIERDSEQGGALTLITKGAPDTLLGASTHIRIGRSVVPLDAAQRSRAVADIEALSGEALRTLSVAYRPLDPDEAPADTASPDRLERDLIFVGTVGIIDPPREEAAAAIADAHRAGIRVIMITGDHPRTALRIATELGIARRGAAAVTGTELDTLGEADLIPALMRSSVFARVAPVHKLRIVQALQSQGNVVAMTGDGVNDAPALKTADVGVAMGIAGTEVTKESAKVILSDDNFATIVAAVREGRVIFSNIRKFLRYLLSSNMGEVLTVFLGVMLAGAIGLAEAGAGAAMALPLLATQILWINFITDSGPALAMGIDAETEDVMAAAPRGRDEPAINVAMWRDVLAYGLVMALATLATIDIFLPGGFIEGTHTLENARTAGFTTLVFAQLFNCLNARSESSSAFTNLRANAWLWAAIAMSVVLQAAVVHVGWLNAAFGTTALGVQQWVVCVGMGSVVLLFGEVRKWIRRSSRLP